MTRTIILITLLATVPAMAQNGSAPDRRLNRGPSCASTADLCSYAGTCSADSCPEPTIPHRWSSDQEDPEARCYHYDASPHRDRLIDRCLKIVRRR